MSKETKKDYFVFAVEDVERYLAPHMGGELGYLSFVIDEGRKRDGLEPFQCIVQEVGSSKEAPTYSKDGLDSEGFLNSEGLVYEGDK